MDFRKLLKNLNYSFVNSMKGKYLRHVPALLAFIFVFVLGWTGSTFLYSHNIDASISNIALREKNRNYRFTNPLLLCDTAAPPHDKELKRLKDRINDIIKKQREKILIKRISIYYRDLDGGRWMGINEDELYSPASLLKVPTMIAFLKFAQEDPDSLNKGIFYDGSFNDNHAEAIKPLKEIEAGNVYTKKELINYMIAYSDNNATRLLDTNINQNFLRNVYTDLGIATPSLHDPIDFMSVKSYSYFFRILYNASYLNREMSEKALNLLSESDFPQGIEGGVPKDIKTAQKFGERVVYTKDNQTPVTKELHDCGIVYYPEHPYLLCVMTEGDDLEKLSRVIQNVSRVTFEETKKEWE